MMKMIHENILQFLDDEENESNNTVNEELIKIFQQNQFDKQELKSILYLISRIAENHHRTPRFLEKIKKIINFLKNQITKAFSNAEIFNYFKQCPIIILFLINDNILTFNYDIGIIIYQNDYQMLFYTELNKIHTVKYEIPEYYEENRLKGENDSYLCELIRNDIIEEFTTYHTKSGFLLSKTIEPSMYETNSFLEKKKPTLIEYSAFFGSIQIFRFLIQNQVELVPSLWLYAIHGRNPDIIHILEENHIYPNDKTYLECLEESIKCHHNEFAHYFLNNYIDEGNDNHSNHFKNEIYYGFQYYNFEFMPIEFKDPFYFYCAVKYDYYRLVEYYINIEGLDINKSIV